MRLRRTRVSEPCHILLIEDNPGDVVLVEESLRTVNLKYKLRHYSTADAALRAVQGYRPGAPEVPDVMLLDYNLPAGNAGDVLLAAVSNPALTKTRKAVLSSSVSPADRDRILGSGCERLLFKPADLDEFL